MTVGSERLIQAAAVAVLLYVGWTLAAQTVVQLIVQHQELAACQAGSRPPGQGTKP